MAGVKGKRFLVTGGAGFIGSNLVERLLNEEAEVTVCDNLSSGKLEFITKFEEYGNFNFVKIDLLEKASLEKTVESNAPEIIIHLAANADVAKGLKETDLDLRQGTISTYNVLESARKSGVSFYHYVSGILSKRSDMPKLSELILTNARLVTTTY